MPPYAGDQATCTPRSALPGYAIALAALLGGVCIAFAAGRYPVSPAELLQVFWSRLGGAPSGLPSALETVVLQIRGPVIRSSPCSWAAW